MFQPVPVLEGGLIHSLLFHGKVEKFGRRLDRRFHVCSLTFWSSLLLLRLGLFMGRKESTSSNDKCLTKIDSEDLYAARRALEMFRVDLLKLLELVIEEVHRTGELGT